MNQSESEFNQSGFILNQSITKNEKKISNIKN